MAKSTRVLELAATLNMNGQQLINQINQLGLGFSVKSKSSTLTEDQVRLIEKAIGSQRQGQTAIDARSQSTAKGTVRIRRRRDESAKAPEAEVEKKTTQMLEPKLEVAPKTTQTQVKKQDISTVKTSETDEKATPPATETTNLVAKEEAGATKDSIDVDIKSDDTKESITTSQTVAEKKKKKSKAKAENIIQIAPKFEKDVSIPMVEFDETEDKLADGLEDDAQIDEQIDDLPLNKAPIKSKTRKKSEPTMASHVLRKTVDETATGASKKKAAKPSNITGTIDPALIKAMLDKDNKVFGGPSNTAERNVKPAAGRTVVNQNQLYGGGGGGNPRTPYGGGNYNRKNRRNQRGQRNQRTLTPAEKKAAHPQAAEHKRVVRMAEYISVAELAKELGVKAAEVIRFLMKDLELMMTVNQSLDLETAEIIAAEYDHTVQDISFNEAAFTESEDDKPEELELRAPVVTVMGHVDHGKTSLLDALRNSRVTASEAGGITQHIGASSIETSNGKVVLLDTPGHEAFTTLRARGAKVTDLVVLVVAADDGVMPQTVEAINHAKAAKVPIIVAINKIDKLGANPERVKQALTEYELIPEDWGGKTLFAEVSAITGDGIQDLLELVQLQAELLELKANPSKEARGIMLEAYKDTRRGTIASIIVQEGTLRINDTIVSGACSGKVKSMFNDRGKSIQTAGPSTPVEITGLSEVPDAGEPFFVTKDEKVARAFTTEIKDRKRNAELASRKFDPWAQFKDNKQLNAIIKADVQGSLEALEKSLQSLSTEDVELQIVHTAVGGTTESDVQLAIASNAMIIGFNTRPEARAADIAKRENIIIESFTIIYDVIDYIKNAMSGLLDPILGENVIGHVEIRETFNAPKIGTIAGGYVTNGVIRRNSHCRLLRQGKIIYESKVSSLKRFKDDAKEVRSGFECGFCIDNYNDIKVGDIVEIFEITETKQTL